MKEISVEDFSFSAHKRREEQEKYIGSECFEGCRTAEVPYIYEGIEIGMPFNLEDIYNKYGKQIFPDCLGIYHLFQGSKLVYIGMSVSIRKRLMCHLREMTDKFDNCLWFCTSIIEKHNSIERTRILESKMINTLRPIYNIQHNKIKNEKETL